MGANDPCMKLGESNQLNSKTKSRKSHVLYTLLAAVAALIKPFIRPSFIKSVNFNETIINARFYFVPSDEKYYLSYMERREYFDLKFGLLVRKKAINVSQFETYRHHYALGVFELDLD